MIKVSVVVPVYNVEKYIAKCLDSLVSQTLKDIEIIIINDGSTDNSQKIINEYKNKYPHLIKSYIKSNGGLSDARNYGMRFCTGEYIGFVDSDDYVDVNMYKHLYETAIEHNSDIVVCDYYKVYGEKLIRVSAKRYENKKEAFINMLAAAWNKLYRRKLIEVNNIKFPYGLVYEDTEFFCKLIPYVQRFDYVNKPYVYYVQRSGSIVNSNTKKTTQIFNIMNNILNYYKSNEFYDFYQAELEYVYVRVLLGSSLERMCKEKNVYRRHALLKETYNQIVISFPEWKRNKYLNSIKTKRHLYMRFINDRTIIWVGDILNIYHRLLSRKLI